MKFQADRARELYREAMRSLPEADRRAQRPGLMMAAIYHALLDEIERDNWQVLHQRISLTPLRKLWLAWKTCGRRPRAGPPAGAVKAAVIGAGWAGLAAAVALREAGAKVTVFEAGHTPGGRAARLPRRIRHAAGQRPAPAVRRLPPHAGADAARRPQPRRPADAPPAAAGQPGRPLPPVGPRACRRPCTWPWPCWARAACPGPTALACCA